MEYIDNYHKNLSVDEEEYFKFIKNKRVAIVGPSSWLNGKKLGAEIDKFDIVVRINQGIFLPENNIDDYGSRTDIIYLSQKARDKYKLDFPDCFSTTKYIMLLTQIKRNDFPTSLLNCFVCNKDITDGQEYCLNKDWDESPEIKLGHPKCIYPNVNYENYPVKIIKRDLAIYQKLFKSSLLTGLLSLIDMIQFHAKTINIYGFDFYNALKTSMKHKTSETKVSDIYCDGYLILKNTLGPSHKDIEGQQIFLFKQLMDKYSNIIIDENLKKIMTEMFQHPLPKFTRFENDFSNFIKNKKIAIVGPAPYLEGMNMGTFIDSYDIVVRLNLGVYLGATNPADYGKTVSIVYINQKVRDKFGLEYPPIFDSSMFIVGQSMKYKGTSIIKCTICNKYISDNQEYYSFSGNFDDKCVHWNCKNYMDYDLFNKKMVLNNTDPLKNKLGEPPLIGLVAIEHILSLYPKEIYVTGFDFFKALKLQKIENDKTKKDTTINVSKIYGKGYRVLDGFDANHKDLNNKQISYMRKLLKNNDKILKVDNYLKKILKKNK